MNAASDKKDITKNTPFELGYHMPAEWERHDAVWLSWPYDTNAFPGRIQNVEKTFVSFIQGTHKSEKVNLLVKNNNIKSRALSFLKKAKIDLNNVNFYNKDYADVWFRDYGPIFVVNRKQEKLAMVKWIFNAWGRKYIDLMRDDNVPSFISEKMGLLCFKPEIVLEGGSIEVNGKGILLTTEQCLLNKNRNPLLTKSQIETYLRQYFGVSHIIWLKDGIEGDDTDGHIDDIARFVSDKLVLCSYEHDKQDKNFKLLKKNYEILRDYSDHYGKEFEVVKLPMPGFIGDKHSRLPASYANFYIGNKSVLVPFFNDKNDKNALGIIQNCFPNREAVGIDCADLLYGLGTLHCISQQQPSI
ncbi:MAG: agmatine deiminase family protein [Nanoarchaeota archaeon]